MTLVEEDGALTHVDWRAWAEDGAGDESPLLAEAARQLAAYFEGRLTRFDLPFAPRASKAQREFCAALSAIPYGETRTYGEMAAALG